MSDYLDQLEEQINISEISDAETRSAVRQLLMMAKGLNVTDGSKDKKKDKSELPKLDPVPGKPKPKDKTVDISTEVLNIKWDTIANESSKKALKELIDIFETSN